VWSREEDMTHDMYRPAALAQLKAGLDAQGNVEAYWYRGVSGSVIHSMVGRIGFSPMGPDKTNAEGQADKVYEFANARYEHVLSKTPVPLGFWRSVGHSQNAFFGECFIDEIAEAAGKNPLALRQQYLKNHPRHLAVLNLAAEKAGWGKPVAAGRALGLALHESFGSIVAQVAEVSVVEKDGKKTPRVHKVTCAIDCGIAVNPDIVRAQMESGIVFGLSAALYGEITIAGGRVEQTNFPSYDMVRLAASPVVETHIVPSTARPEGVGEPGTPPVAPAVANALYALTKKRVRQLPIRL
jgi:isoquinoline 1-oxidoreductase subunit beta